ncbi:hypothetical protein M3E84_01970 [Kocuria sp. p3-SID1428]|uniref:hypothetical protein n=1 Tax=Kocuria sp. p3-SID1428 TaxID=2916182 RepID=UPI0021A42323|nr:hypothetical protein [Kocuria sp. p3-SID1428]MCT1601085.1 hypothetical protein [Kocuria sp. p3-SID1428]
MDEPTCRSCQTADYLRILDYSERETWERTIPVNGGTIRKPASKAAEASFFCARCGAFNGHSVPDDWAPADGQVSDEEILARFGAYWKSPSQRVEPMPDGRGYKITGR